MALVQRRRRGGRRKPAGRWFLMTDHDDTADVMAGTEAGAEAGDVEEAEELLVEEISIDGMCGVY
jgi:mycofactocin precursor